MKNNKFKKEAFGWTLSRIIKEELDEHVKNTEDANKYINMLHEKWKFQRDKDGQDYSVPLETWDALMKIIKIRFPNVITKSWFDSKAKEEFENYRRPTKSL